MRFDRSVNSWRRRGVVRMSAMREPVVLDTAERIRLAAVELFAERGYDGTSVRDIATRAGVRKALVFYHHTSKADLYGGIVRQYYAEHRAALRAAFAVEAPMRERLHGVIDAYVDYISENRLFPRLIQHHIAGSSAPPEIVQEGVGSLIEVTRAALAGFAPDTGPMSSRHLHMTFHGAVVGFFSHAGAAGAAWGGDPLSPEGIAERRAHLHFLVDALVDALVAAGPASGAVR